MGGRKAVVLTVDLKTLSGRRLLRWPWLWHWPSCRPPRGLAWWWLLWWRPPCGLPRWHRSRPRRRWPSRCWPRWPDWTTLDTSPLRLRLYGAALASKGAGFVSTMLASSPRWQRASLDHLMCGHRSSTALVARGRDCARRSGLPAAIVTGVPDTARRVGLSREFV
jgi:hypothetical protein